MRLTFLGTGTSTGIPVIGCKCEVCMSEDPRDKRFRTAALLETDTTRVLIDCGPDIRMQLLPVPFKMTTWADWTTCALIVTLSATSTSTPTPVP